MEVKGAVFCVLHLKQVKPGKIFFDYYVTNPVL